MHPAHWCIYFHCSRALHEQPHKPHLGEASILQEPIESLACVLNNTFVAVQAMQGEGFLHQGQLPTNLPKLHINLAPSSCQSEKATTMLPLTGRDPRLVEAVKEFQDALLIARQSG